jgi:hypothetical protein
MSDEARWGDLRPILKDMADRIARIEQFLAASGLQAPSQGSPSDGSGAFDSVPGSFEAPPAFSTPGQIAEAAAGLSPFPGPPPGVVPDDIVLLARSGKMIQAIDQYRRLTGVSLKESKAIVERAARGL